jgi:hypothetical protein
MSDGLEIRWSCKTGNNSKYVKQNKKRYSI